MSDKLISELVTKIENLIIDNVMDRLFGSSDKSKKKESIDKKRQKNITVLLDSPLQSPKESNVVEDISEDQGQLWKTLTDKQKEMYLDDELNDYMG